MTKIHTCESQGNSNSHSKLGKNELVLQTLLGDDYNDAVNKEHTEQIFGIVIEH